MFTIHAVTKKLKAPVRLMCSTLAALFLTVGMVHAAEMLVHKNIGCMCCDSWATHVRANGHHVTMVGDRNLPAYKASLGIPEALWSCHTAVVDGYFIEGHVPVEDIERLLAEKPDALGLTVPGMPLGSPGMEVPSGALDNYNVLLVMKDGSTQIYASYP